MATLEILNALSAGTSNWDHIVGRSSPELTRSEIAGMLAGLSRPAELLAWAKYMQDEASLRNFKFFMIQFTAGIAVDQGWKIKKGKPCVYRLGELVATELVNDGIRQKSMSESEKAQYVGVSKSCWSEIWQQRRNELFYSGQGFEFEIRAKLNKQYQHSIEI